MARAPAAGRREVGVAALKGHGSGREMGQTDPEGPPVTLLALQVVVVVGRSRGTALKAGQNQDGRPSEETVR